jgi:hypothetical protein
MLRQLKNRRSVGSVSLARKLQMQQSRIHSYSESSADRRDHHSETDTSFTQLHTEKMENHQAGSTGKSIKSTIFAARMQLVQTTWGIAVSSRGPTLSRHGSLQFLCMMMSMKLHKNHLILLILADSSVMLLHQMVLLLLIPSRPSRIQQQLAAETSCNKYKGSSMDMIASTVTSLPRNRATEALLPLLVADPVFSIQDSVPESEGAIHTKKLPGCRGSDVPLTMNQWMQKQKTNKMVGILHIFLIPKMCCCHECKEQSPC